MQRIDDEAVEALINVVLDMLDASLHKRVVRAAQEHMPTRFITYNEKTFRVRVESC